MPREFLTSKRALLCLALLCVASKAHLGGKWVPDHVIKVSYKFKQYCLEMLIGCLVVSEETTLVAPLAAKPHESLHPLKIMESYKVYLQIMRCCIVNAMLL